jgi:hypothetical protein
MTMMLVFLIGIVVGYILEICASHYMCVKTGRTCACGYDPKKGAQ